MHMRHEIAHMRIVHGCLRLGFPGLHRRRIVGIKTDDIELGQIAKFGAVQILEFATENKVEKLLAVRRHELPSQKCWRPSGQFCPTHCIWKPPKSFPSFAAGIFHAPPEFSTSPQLTPEKLLFSKPIYASRRGVDFGVNLRRRGGQQTMPRILAVIDNRASIETCQTASCFMKDEIGRRNIPVMGIFRGKASIERTGGDRGNPQRKRRNLRLQIEMKTQLHAAVWRGTPALPPSTHASIARSFETSMILSLSRAPAPLTAT